jgi:hypothetical protein
MESLSIIEGMMRYPLALILLSLLLTACNRPGIKTQRELAGTWVVDLGGNLRSTDVIKPNGSYECQITGNTNARIITVDGILLVQGNLLVDTITKYNTTNLPVPAVFRGHVISIDEHEFVAQWDSLTNATVARKIAQ